MYDEESSMVYLARVRIRLEEEHLGLYIKKITKSEKSFILS